MDIDAIRRIEAGKLASEQEIDDLIASLGVASKAVQRSAAEALGRVANDSQRIRLRLIAHLGSPSVHLRWGATYALGRICRLPSEAIPVAIEFLGDADPDVRWAAHGLLNRFDDPAAVIAGLLGSMGSESPLRRKMVMYALRDLGTPSPEVDAAIGSALGDADSDVVLAALAAASSCCRTSASVLAAIVALLDHPTPGVRRAATIALGDSKLDSARPRLESLLDSEDASIRQAARRSLERIR